MKLTIPIEPMGAVRMTQHGKWTSSTAKRYLDYKTRVGWALKASGCSPTEAVCGVRIKFHMPIPESWSKKKKDEAHGKPHGKKPDIDNLIKGLFDAATGIVWRDDNQVMRVEAEKVYSSEIGIEFEVTEVF